jgi:hypothetical protein
MQQLFTFAHFLRVDDSLNYLADRLSLTENWSYSDPEKELKEGNNAASFPLPILRNYLDHTFRKVRSENKIAETDDGNFCCFNTGLVTSNLEEIFAMFEINRSPTARAKWFFRKFIKKSDRDFLIHFSQREPAFANYFDQPAQLIFNPKLQLITDVDHIIQDNLYRFPEGLKSLSAREIRTRLIGAIDDISKRVKINYKIAIPQFYDNKFQLLLPLYLDTDTKPDLALVVEKINDTTYSARTCLTIGMAYNNARLIVCPHSEWLQP